VLIKPALIEKMKRTNTTIVHMQQQWVEFAPRYNLYTIKMDRERNCYNCRGFRYIVKYYRNQKFIVQERRMKSRENHNTDNLEKENLVVLN